MNTMTEDKYAIVTVEGGPMSTSGHSEPVIASWYCEEGWTGDMQKAKMFDNPQAATEAACEVVAGQFFTENGCERLRIVRCVEKTERTIAIYGGEKQ